MALALCTYIKLELNFMQPKFKLTIKSQNMYTFITHADESRGSKAFIRVCLCVCLSAR